MTPLPLVSDNGASAPSRACATDWARFIRENTLLQAPPLVPEIELHLAAESLPIWQRTEEELGELNVPPPFWAFAWAGGQALARYVLDNPQLVAQRNVLDLGAGAGLVGIAAMRAGAASVLCADIDELALAATKLNAAANGVEIALTSADLLDAAPPICDVLLIGDLFYERTLAERVRSFAAAAQVRGATVLAGDPRRSYFPAGFFTPVAMYRVPVTRELEDAEIKCTTVWRAL